MPSETRAPVAINRRCSLIFSTSLSLLALLRIRLMMLHLRLGVEWRHLVCSGCRAQ